MSKFTKITLETLITDEKFSKYLCRADIKLANKGGTFVGNREIASNEFRKYGIVLPKGGMIIPDIEPEEILHLQNSLREAEQLASRKKWEDEVMERDRQERDYVRLFAETCKEFPMLGIRIMMLDNPADDMKRFSVAVVVNDKNEEVFIIVKSGYPSATIEDFKKSLEIETAIAEFRRSAVNRIIELQKELDEVFAGSIIACDWQGREIYQPFKTEKLLLSHGLYFENIGYVNWDEKGINDLTVGINVILKKVSSQNRESMQRLQAMPLTDSFIRAEELPFADPGDPLYLLWVNGKSIPFPTEQNLRKAEEWALEQGAFLEHHYRLGIGMRNRAKAEKWSERQSLLANKMSCGEKINERRTQVHYMKGTNDRSQSRSGYADLIYLGNIQISQDELKFINSLG